MDILIDCKEVHPLNKELISVIKDESKLEKSMFSMFSVFLSLLLSKKPFKVSTGFEKCISILVPEFIFNSSSTAYLLWSFSFIIKLILISFL